MNGALRASDLAQFNFLRQRSPMRIANMIAALLIGMLMGVGITMALQVSVPTADAGDWLAFAGALVGVVSTILGTLWLDHYRSAAKERAQRKTVIASLNDIASALQAVRQPRGAEEIAVARPARVALEDALLNTFDKFVYARHYIPHHDIDCWHAIEVLNETITRERPTIEREARMLRDVGDNEAVFQINIENMDMAAQRLTPPLETAMKEIQN